MVNWFQRFTADDEREVRAFMQRLSVSPLSELPTPADVRLLWLRSQLMKRWEAERAVHAPLDLIDRLQLAGGFATAAGLVAWSFPDQLRLMIRLFV
jgi:hypothetical protein